MPDQVRHDEGGARPFASSRLCVKKENAFAPLCIKFSHKHHDPPHTLPTQSATTPPNPTGATIPSQKQTTLYRLGAAAALGTGALQVWMNLAVGIVGSEDNPTTRGFYLVVVTAAACAFTARGRADGMARAMLATAAVQALLAAVVATAPSTAIDDPKGPLGVLALSGGFTALWLLAAFLFHRSARLELRDIAAASGPPR